MDVKAIWRSSETIRFLKTLLSVDSIYWTKL